MTKDTMRMKTNEEKYPALLFTPHITLICGAKGSGKSQLTCKLLLNPYRFLYDEIVFVSPTFKSQLPTLWSTLDPTGITVYEELSQEFVDTFQMEQSTSTKNTLLILDDVGNQQRMLKGNSWNALISNSRHYRLSIISLHQKLTQAETCTRTNADTIICFPSCSFMEREALYRARSSVDRKTFMDLFERATEKSYSFLCCTIKKSKLKFYLSDLKTEIHPRKQ